jgi:uncharacterized protein YcbK (DUF882 family)
MLAAVCAGVLATGGLSGTAQAETRTLSFKQLHTGETVTITFKRNGRYDREGLKQINYILRDWRRNESTTMDPALLDLVWEVRNAVGSKAPIYVLSGYRSPVTNAMLRSRSRGVAKYSQHMVGKALDFYLPDIPLKTLRETALKFQRGGVGYYPTSGSPFVHMDTGNVRHWPRMTRSQLAKLFPDGKTLHIPSDGKPMPGYNQAVAQLKQTAPSQGSSTRSSSGRQQVASTYPRLDPSVAITPASVSRSTGSNSGSSRNLIAALFESGEDGDEEGASNKNSSAPAADAAPAKEEPKAEQPTVVASLSPSDPAPIPRAKPEIEIPAVAALSDAPVPTPKPVLVAAADAEASAAQEMVVAEAPASAEKPLITASVAPPAWVVGDTPKARPLMSGNDAISMLLAGNAPQNAAPKPAEPQSEPMTATALAPTDNNTEMAPFNATFTGQVVPMRDGPVLVAIDYRPEALQPYMDTDNCLRGDSFVALRHPDQTDIGALTGISGTVVVNTFSNGPQLIYPMRKFTGPAVSPVATRTYQVAGLADDMTTASIDTRPLERASALR